MKRSIQLRSLIKLAVMIPLDHPIWVRRNDRDRGLTREEGQYRICVRRLYLKWQHRENIAQTGRVLGGIGRLTRGQQRPERLPDPVDDEMDFRAESPRKRPRA